MTLTTDDQEASLVLPEHGTGERTRRRESERRARLRTAGFFVTLAILAASIPALGYVGFRTVFDSRDGRVVSPRTDPNAPGFEAAVEPTPTLLVVQHDAAGELDGLTVLSLSSGDHGGSVLFVPVTTTLDLGSFGTHPAATAYRGGGADAVRIALGRTLAVGLDQVVDLDAAGWSALLRPVGAVRIDNPDPVISQGSVVFPAGTVDVAPEEAAAYLALRSEGQSEAARLGRQEFFWEGWLGAVGSGQHANVAPGEVDTGIGRFVRTLAAGNVRYETLPTLDNGAVDHDRARDLLADVVPLPVGVEPGQRPRVRLLSGTADHALSRSPVVTRPLVAAGAEIAIVGNSDRFTYATTEVVYADPARRGEAQRLRDALGAGRLVRAERPTDGIDVTIVLGNDVQRLTNEGGSTG